MVPSTLPLPTGTVVLGSFPPATRLPDSSVSDHSGVTLVSGPAPKLASSAVTVKRFRVRIRRFREA